MHAADKQMLRCTSRGRGRYIHRSETYSKERSRRDSQTVTAGLCSPTLGDSLHYLWEEREESSADAEGAEGIQTVIPTFRSQPLIRFSGFHPKYDAYARFIWFVCASWASLLLILIHWFKKQEKSAGFTIFWWVVSSEKGRYKAEGHFDPGSYFSSFVPIWRYGKGSS